MFDMNQWIDGLYVAEDTKKLLKELVVRKDKKSALKLRLIGLTVLNSFIILMIMFWLMRINMISNSNIFGVIDYFSSSRAAMIFLMMAASTFVYAGYVSKQYKKRKEKYDNLRAEVARKISTSWKVTDDSKIKDQISEVLKSQKNINIRYMK